MIHGKIKFTHLSKLASPRNSLLKIILIAQLAVVLCVGAQEPGGEADLSQPLTLEQCIQIGLEKATSMRNARLNLAITRASRKNRTC